MYLAYMDECGNTGVKADPNQPIHFLGCLVVEDIHIRPFESAIADVARRYFPSVAGKPDFEFHGVDLFGGSGHFKVDPQKRIESTRALIEAAVEHSATFGYVGIDKTKSLARDHPHRICFTLLVEHLETWLKRRESLALLVSDENHEVEQALITDIATFKASSTTWGYRNMPVEHIVDSIHFVKSHNNPIIQVADVLTYVTLKALLIKRDRFAEFRRRSDKKQTWPDWTAENYTRPQRATRDLWFAIDMFLFVQKVWPS